MNFIRPARQVRRISQARLPATIIVFSAFAALSISSSRAIAAPDFSAMENQYMTRVDSLGSDAPAIQSATLSYAAQLRDAAESSTGEASEKALVESSVYFHLAGDSVVAKEVLRQAAATIRAWPAKLLFIDAALELGQRDLARVAAVALIPEAKDNPAQAAQLVPILNTLGMNQEALMILQANHSARGNAGAGARSAKASRGALRDNRGVAPIPFTSRAFGGGGTVSLSKYKGKVVVLDFWATWCGPCMREMPMVKRMYEDLRRDGLVIIGISLDKNAGDLQRAIGKYGLDWPQVYDGKGWNAAVAKKYGVNAIPHTVLISRAGRIVGRGLRGGQLRQAVEAELAR